MVSLTQIRWITGGKIRIAPREWQYIMEEYSKGDAYLLGRVTYEMLWPGWSTQTTGDGPGPILNRMHKYVVSTTLTTLPGKNPPSSQEMWWKKSPN